MEILENLGRIVLGVKKDTEWEIKKLFWWED
jgi:hypothetical protein